MSSRPGQPLYGSGSAPKSLTVSWDALPGALCLLREACSHSFEPGSVLHQAAAVAAAAAAAGTWHLLKPTVRNVVEARVPELSRSAVTSEDASSSPCLRRFVHACGL